MFRGTPLLVSIVLLLALPSFFFTGSFPTPSQDSSTQPGTVTPFVIIHNTALAPSCSSTGLCPSQLRKAYGFDILLTKGVNGAGQTVVIDDACGDPTIASDLHKFDLRFGLADPKFKIIYPQGTKNLCSSSGWSVETSLDVEWAHVVAPNASIDLLVANQPSPADMYRAWNYSLANNLGNQISNSYGGAGCFQKCNGTIGQGIGPCTMTNGTQGINVQTILSSASSKHVTILASAGDSGYWGNGTPNEEPIPGDCKGVLTVGGTTLIVDSSGNYLSENAWSGTGGGYATAPGEPKYQSSAGITDPFGSLAKPDVAAVADPNTGVWVYNGGWFRVGGTSLSSPLWAGFLADANQIRATHGLSPAGFLNGFLYKTFLGSGTGTMYAKNFNDIKTGSNGWPAGPGWDSDTGLGSFKASTLAYTLGNATNA